jgi:hypothetical protein
MVGIPLLFTLFMATALDVPYLVMLAAHFGPWSVLAALVAIVSYRFFGSRFIRAARRWLSGRRR